MFLGLILVIGVTAVPCGGADGGSPFAARASAQGRTCAFLEDTWLPLLAAIGARRPGDRRGRVVSWVRTAERRNRAMRLAAGVPLIPVLLAILPFFIALADSCPSNLPG